MSRAGPASLEKKAGRAGLQRAIDVVVGVERGDDDHTKWVGDVGTGEGARDLDAVELRHTDIEQGHVGPQLPSQADGLCAVAGFSDDRDVGLGLQDEPEPAPDHRLIVGEEDVDAHDPVRTGTGRLARTAHPASCRGPACSDPPRASTRSRMPASP
jgi:hypothetical protein